MKLISKTILLYLLISLPLLILAGFYAYNLINTEVKDGTDDALYRETLNMQNLVKTLTQPRSLYLDADSLTGVTLLKEKSFDYKTSDTVIYDRLEEEDLRYRLHRSGFSYNGNHYLISVAKPTLEEEELKEGLLTAFLLIFGFLVISFFVVNIVLSRTLWKPFYKTLQRLETYNINQQEEICFDKTTIREFNKLNDTLGRMTQKIRADYRQQKEFTENASHELQTPLAVIKTKLDLLIQSKKLGQEELELLQAMENAVHKMASLNKALLLLTRIENKQFAENKTVNMPGVVERALENYSALYESKGMTIKKQLATLQVEMNPILADLLVNNLVQNAFRHGVKNGTVVVEIAGEKLIVMNTGEPLQVKPEELYLRFKKNESSAESLGLGLSIVKSIATLYGFKLGYAYTNGTHAFSVWLKPQTDLL